MLSPHWLKRLKIHLKEKNSTPDLYVLKLLQENQNMEDPVETAVDSVVKVAEEETTEAALDPVAEVMIDLHPEEEAPHPMITEGVPEVEVQNGQVKETQKEVTTEEEKEAEKDLEDKKFIF